jgi:diacylglycerol kinase family enzyme
LSLDGVEPPKVHLAEFDPSQDLMGRHKRMSRTARLLFLLLLSLGAATLLATGGLMAFPATGQAQSLRSVAAASPDIPFDDGEFDVIIITESQREALLNYIDDRIKNGKETPFFHTSLKARKVEINWGGKLMHIDDELIELDKFQKLEIEILRDVLTFLV